MDLREVCSWRKLDIDGSSHREQDGGIGDEGFVVVFL